MLIRYFASSWSGSVIAAAEFERTVHVWDFDGPRHLATFPTIMDFGGTRLAVTPDGRNCIAAAYHVEGIAGYVASDGTELWRRKDLKKTQTLRVSLDGRRVYACFDNRSCQVLNRETGKTIKTWAGVRDVWQSRTNRLCCWRSGRWSCNRQRSERSQPSRLNRLQCFAWRSLLALCACLSAAVRCGAWTCRLATSVGASRKRDNTSWSLPSPSRHKHSSAFAGPTNVAACSGFFASSHNQARRRSSPIWAKPVISSSVREGRACCPQMARSWIRRQGVALVGWLFRELKRCQGAEKVQDPFCNNEESKRALTPFELPAILVPRGLLALRAGPAGELSCSPARRGLADASCLLSLRYSSP
jgi:hypothetical protein